MSNFKTFMENEMDRPLATNQSQIVINETAIGDSEQRCYDKPRGVDVGLVAHTVHKFIHGNRSDVYHTAWQKEVLPKQDKINAYLIAPY